MTMVEPQCFFVDYFLNGGGHCVIES